MVQAPMTDPPGGSVIQAAVLRRLAPLGLPTGARVLDAPCGEGWLTAALARRGLDVHGADVEPAAAALLGDRFSLADLTRPFPWPDACFDAVFSLEGIEHLENGYAFLREV